MSPIVWNVHSKSSKDVALVKIRELAGLLPHPTIQSRYFPSSAADIKTPSSDDKTSTKRSISGSSRQPAADAADPVRATLAHPEELASRSLLLGILHRTAGEYETSRLFLEEVLSQRTELGTSWVVPTAMFELASLELVEVESKARGKVPNSEETGNWREALDKASNRLEQVGPLAAASSGLATRIEGRVTMLKDEIGYKRTALKL
jgi:hypothetical protein